MRNITTFFLLISIFFLAIYSEERVEIPSVSDLRILSPADLKISADSFSVRAFDRTFSFRVKKTVQNLSGNRLEQYKNVEGEETLTLTVVNDVQGILMGTLWRDGEMYHVHALSSYTKDIQNAGFTVDLASKQVIFKESAVREDENHKTAREGVNPASESISRLKLNEKRQDTSEDVAQSLPTLNCPVSPKTLPFSVAIDAKFIRRLGEGGLNPENFVRSLVSTMSDVYMKTVNVGFEVDEIVQFPTEGFPSWNHATCPDIQTKLSQFSEWRGSRNANAGLWHLITGCYLSRTNGMAWVGVLCTTNSTDQGNGQFVSGTGVSSGIAYSSGWRVMALEVGHNFGSADAIMGINDVFSRAGQQRMCDEIYSSGKCLAISPCTPSCSGKNCGFDGCGGSCGTCDSAGTCSSSGTCQTCQKNCNGKSCGDDGCGGTCGICASGDTCSTSGTCVNRGRSPDSTWLELHNAERRHYRIGSLSWDTASAQVAFDHANRCEWVHNPNRSRGENIAAYSGDQTDNIPLLFKSWTKEKSNWDCPNNAVVNNTVVGHFTQIVWEQSTRVGCAIVFCRTGSPFGSFPDWTFAVCDYTPPGNYIEQRPFDANTCSESCFPSTSCAAENRQCGAINDGCKTVSCGTCGPDSVCNSQGLCTCKPSGSCSSAGRTCGTLFDGCNGLDCGRCPSGYMCSAQGCVQDAPSVCTPTNVTCTDRGLNCGSFNNGCDDITCGACIFGETCMQGICKSCVGCSQFSTCADSKCKCLDGYQGDGFTCNPIPEVPLGGTDSWTAISGSPSTWTRVGIDLINSNSGLSGIFLTDSGARLTGHSAVTWTAKVMRLSNSTDAGIAFAYNGNNYWVLAVRPDKAVLYAICSGGMICSGEYVIGTGSFPSNQFLDVKIEIKDTSAVYFTVDSLVSGPWTCSSGWAGDMGVFTKGGSASFEEAVLKTSSYLSISLVDCLTPEEFSAKIEAILRLEQGSVPPSSVTSNCKKRQASGSFLYTFQLLGNSQASAPSLASQLSTKVFTNHPALVGNGVNAASAVQAVPASLSGAQVAAITGGVVAAAALSTAAIIGIAVGGGVGLAAVTGGAVATGVIIKKRREEDNQIPMQTQGKRVDLLSSPNQSGFSSITARGVQQQ
eukprot:TRINITY_DN2678_c0_g1_i3.p1 TRINITY_DN2678_c0_g1~~TRINITY_DN2678_c0_g1_i3.p1  ORF type:complete len:1126 (-),score=283.22 TRINITY_DN2678_c0_g1_i3:1037-4414(-)